MLQPKALAAWNGEEAERARRDIHYWGVFTPADINWKIQVDRKAESLGRQGADEFVNAVFLSHFREAFVACILQLTRDRPRTDHGDSSTRAEMSKATEIEFCVELANAWKLSLGIPSLDGLKVALVDELTQPGRTRSYSEFTPYMKRLVGMNLIDVAREISTHFVAANGLYDARWALCFDELEIAPTSIQEDLFQYLRSTDQNLVFKLAISPSNDASGLLNSVGSASANNDCDAIPLWFVDQKEREMFCERLWHKLASGTPAEHYAPHVLLQRSRLQYANIEISHGPRRYQGAHSWRNEFISLERKDHSFAEYLRKNEVKSDALELTPRSKMNSVVRKIAPLVGFRNSYFVDQRGESPAHAVRKPLKRPPPDVFSGWEAICAATEGNPRWFSGIASRLILKWRQSLSGKELTREQQAHELETSAKKFLAWINAIPVDVAGDGSLQLSVSDLIAALAKYFEQSVIGRTFTADPVLSFLVDEATPESIQRLVIAALNIGAVVISDDEDVNLIGASPVGRNFRLVHLLAPVLSLPMRKGKSRLLSTILTKRLGPLEQYDVSVSRNEDNRGGRQLGLFTRYLSDQDSLTWQRSSGQSRTMISQSLFLGSSPVLCIF
jgi:hypothetical protein